MLSKLGYDLVCIDDLNDPDIPEQELQSLIKNLKNYCNKYDVEFHRTDVTDSKNTDLYDMEFDAVIALDLIEHIHRSQKFLSTARESLDHNGKLIILTPNGVHLPRRIQMVLDQQTNSPLDAINSPGTFRSHIKEYTNVELNELLRTNGFDPIKTMFFTKRYKDASDRSNNR